MVDLGEVRTSDTAIVVWDWDWAGTSFNVEYSTDGETFTRVTGLSAPENYAGNDATKHSFDPVDARFFRIVEASGAGLNLLNQVMFYSPEILGSPVEVTDFAVADQTTGSTVCTNSATIDVTAFAAATTAEGATVDGYLITEDDHAPDLGAAWQPAPPATYTITGGIGLVNLYAWAKDDQDNISRSNSLSILYETRLVTVSNVNLFSPAVGELEVSWDTNIPSEGALEVRALDPPGTVTTTFREGAVGTSHVLTATGIEEGTTYRVAIINNEQENEVKLWPESGAGGATVQVVGYNWLQLPDGVTAMIGGDAGVTATDDETTGSGFGAPSWFRWGTRVWIPNEALTSASAPGDSAYWAVIKLDKKRMVTSVKTQWYCAEGNALHKFTVEASDDGETWTEIGSWDYGMDGDVKLFCSDYFVTDVNVTDTECLYVRVKVAAGDYTYGSANRAGPGLTALEPAGDGLVEQHRVNWANRAFGTTLTNHSLNFNGSNHTDGWVFDDGNRTGATCVDRELEPGLTKKMWPEDAALELDFGEPRVINRACMMWEYDWVAQGFRVQYFDGTDWQPVTGLSDPVYYSSGGVTMHSFDAVETQKVRIVDVWGVQPHAICTEVFFFSTERVLPIPGDANMDCKVNILDLIFVRNRLNQSVDTGDNWQADVNEDGKINILDLIFTRNHLNTTCP